MTPSSRGSILFLMLRRHPALRITIALLVALAVGIAGPIHAAHHHGDPNSLHPACALCQLHSPACQPLLEPGVGISLEPICTFALLHTPSLRSASVAFTDTRGPPSLLA
ncbi:MAG TPA: hypothetical protein VJS69_03200 [Candidatus Krumholzibacteria bacterium]|nr:hypothetical protein [Candidatus Krumholzibacteria bacterium]